MNKSFYPKMALSGIFKNKRMTFPYIITCAGTVSMFYMMASIVYNSHVNELPGGVALATILRMGITVTALLSVIFLFYTNSFLSKHRQRELGVYSILGMEKKHIARLLFLENTYIAVFSIAIGIGAGMLLSKLMFLAVGRLIGVKIPLVYEINFEIIWKTVLLFAAVFAAIFIFTAVRTGISNPMKLLQMSKEGEKEPKAKWISAVLGVVFLGCGYAIAVTVKNPVSAIILFFIAVLFVIFGTYLLFSASSIAILKLMKKNKKFYYKTRNFISVSGMLYRMRQNAVGIANICILSTAVLVMISSTLSLYAGTESSLILRYPYEIGIKSETYSQQVIEKITEATDNVLKNENLRKSESFSARSINIAMVQHGSEFGFFHSNLLNEEGMCAMTFIPLEDYNRMTGQSLKLQKGEILLSHSKNSPQLSQIKLGELNYRVADSVPIPKEYAKNPDVAALSGLYFGIVSDIQELERIQAQEKAEYGERGSAIHYELGFDLENATEEGLLELGGKLRSAFNAEKLSATVESRSASRADITAFNGSLFFLGIFFGTMFLAATVLVIYYKQISEGYDDRHRFEIMQKVGLDKKDIKASVHSQVLTVFFMPLVTAAIHIAFAFPIINKCLNAFNLYNTKLFAICTVISVGLFAVVYAAVYALTSQIYYKTVSGGEKK